VTRVALCGICDEQMAGSALLTLTSEAVASLYLLHIIDRHWDIVERIHATTSDPAARTVLIGELAKEWGHDH